MVVAIEYESVDVSVVSRATSARAGLVPWFGEAVTGVDFGLRRSPADAAFAESVLAASGIAKRKIRCRLSMNKSLPGPADLVIVKFEEFLGSAAGLATLRTIGD